MTRGLRACAECGSRDFLFGKGCLVALSIAKCWWLMEISGRIEINPSSSFQLPSLKILSFFFFFKKYFNLATTLDMQCLGFGSIYFSNFHILV